MIAEFKGQNGKLIIHNDYLEITRETFGGFISQGASSGSRKYFYKDISSFEYKKPTFISNGYFKVLISGTNETNAKIDLLGSSKASMKDQNTVVLRAFTSKVAQETDRIHGIVMGKLREAKTDKSSVNQSSSKMDELKKLGELRSSGILSDEEFQKEKEKILNG